MVHTLSPLHILYPKGEMQANPPLKAYHGLILRLKKHHPPRRCCLDLRRCRSPDSEN